MIAVAGWRTIVLELPAALVRLDSVVVGLVRKWGEGGMAQPSQASLDQVSPTLRTVGTRIDPHLFPSFR